MTAREDETVQVVGQRAREADVGEVLLLDALQRPIGWIPVDHLPSEGAVDASMAIAKSPFLDRRTTLKDATSMLLGADVPAGIVVDRDGRLQGLLTFAAVVAAMRDGRDQAEAETGQPSGSAGS